MRARTKTLQRLPARQFRIRLVLMVDRASLAVVCDGYMREEPRALVLLDRWYESDAPPLVPAVHERFYVAVLDQTFLVRDVSRMPVEGGEAVVVTVMEGPR